jgi:hypothetical protein
VGLFLDEVLDVDSARSWVEEGALPIHLLGKERSHGVKRFDWAVARMFVSVMALQGLSKRGREWGMERKDSG